MPLFEPIASASPSARALHAERYDVLAMSLSGLCLAHCLLLPSMSALLPLIATRFAANEHVHLWMLVAVVPTSLFALGSGWLRHRRSILLAFGTLGLCLLSIAALGHEAGRITEFGDRLLTMIGGLVLALVHFANFRQLHAQKHLHAAGSCSSVPA